jgi:hypothetical protein
MLLSYPRLNLYPLNHDLSNSCLTPISLDGYRLDFLQVSKRECSPITFSFDDTKELPPDLVFETGNDDNSMAVFILYSDIHHSTLT